MSNGFVFATTENYIQTCVRRSTRNLKNVMPTVILTLYKSKLKIKFFPKFILLIVKLLDQINVL